MRRYGLPLLCLLVAAGCVRLGVWQVSRLKERRARNAALAARLSQVLDSTAAGWHCAVIVNNQVSAAR